MNHLIDMLLAHSQSPEDEGPLLSSRIPQQTTGRHCIVETEQAPALGYLWIIPQTSIWVPQVLLLMSRVVFANTFNNVALFDLRTIISDLSMVRLVMSFKV